MKSIKRIVAICLVAVMLFSLSSCTLGNTSETEISNDNIKIGVILSDKKDSNTGTAGICNSTINELTGLGYGINGERFKYAEDVDPNNADSVAAAFKSLVNFECNMIIASDPAYMDDISKVAAENPSIAFFVYNGTSNGSNVFSYSANITAAAYLEGIAAGMKAKELNVPKLGYILANAGDYTTLNAFYSGAKSVYPTVTAEAVVAGDIAADAQKLITNGAVVLASDIQSEEIAKAATDAKIFFCGFGCEAVTEDYADAYLCTPLYSFTQYFVDTIKTIVDFETPEDSDKGAIELVVSQGLIKDYNGGYLTGATYLSDVSLANAAKGTTEAVKAAAETILNGSLKIELSATNLVSGITLVK